MIYQKAVEFKILCIVFLENSPKWEEEPQFLPLNGYWR